jgi:hypothetical protein
VLSRKTKRVAVVTAVSALLTIGGTAALAHEDGEKIDCPRGTGRGLGHGHPGGDKGKGLDKGWPHKCDEHDKNSGGSKKGGDSNGGGVGNDGGDSNNGGATVSDDHGTDVQGGGTISDNSDVDVNVTVEVDLPNLPLPDVAVGDVVDHARTAVDQTVMLAENDVERLMAIVDAASTDATSLIGGAAQAGVLINGTSGSGTVNVSSGALAGATTLGSGIAASTVALVDENATGGRAILGSMLATL